MYSFMLFHVHVGWLKNFEENIKNAMWCYVPCVHIIIIILKIINIFFLNIFKVFK